MSQTPIKGQETVKVYLVLKEETTLTKEAAHDLNRTILHAFEQSLEGKWDEIEFYDGEFTSGSFEDEVELVFRLTLDGYSVHEEEVWENGELVCPEEYFEDWPDAPMTMDTARFVSLIPLSIDEPDYYIDEPEILYPGL